MSATTFIIEANKTENTGLQDLRAYFPGVEITSYAVGTSRSGAPADTTEIRIEDDAVVVAEFDNNIRWFYSKETFTVKVRQQQALSRGAVPGRRPEIPLVWQDGSPSRGFLSGMLKLLGISIVRKAGKNLAQAIAGRIEAQNGNILYKCDAGFNLVKWEEPAADARAKYLLFLHGTGSGTAGSFAALKKEQNGKVYDALYKKYGGNVIAYDHRTFTQSPVRNVIDLVKQLPDTITLDLVSHSRGGLVGEVLARIGKAGERSAFSPQETELLKQNEDAAALLAEIEELHALLAQKKVTVERFVRVACPAAGTTLVSDRMDMFLNVLFNIFSNFPGEVVSTVAEGLQALVMAVVNEKNDPASLPGIECMRPGSAFIKVLNFKETRIDSQLTVIAGDAQGEGFVSRLKMFLVDAFYKEDNDLVVNTASMKRGTVRSGAVAVFDERRPNVNHFNYFVNTSSRNIIYEALAGGREARSREGSLLDAAADGRPVPVIEGPVTRSGKGIADQPVLYVLPGIMGSHLQDGDDRIWLNYLRMATGGLRRLKISSPTVSASGINASAYGEFVQYFGNTHYVIPFAYDWRKSVFDAADKLNESVTRSLSQTGKTISFMVHSMGGLVLRAFAIRYADTWNSLRARSGFRVLMLGTPNKGSYDIPRILLGIGRNINLVSLLDIAHSRKTLLQQFVQYPGLLNLLPAFGERDFTLEATWKEIWEAAESEYPVPASGDLATFADMLRPQFSNFRWDPDIVKYVAGKNDLTAVKIEVDKANKRVDFYGTARGDGSVTWDSIPEELRSATYYIDAVHGDMASYNKAFAGYRELLEKGTTQLLSKVPPVTRGDDGRVELMPQADPVVFTNEADMSRHIMGMTVTEERPAAPEISISITHGDMGHALYPLVAGHFRGDAIIQAEQVLNQKLDNYFTIRYEAGNYPGRIGTHAIVLRKDAMPPGGIVVGLGDFGELTENTLYLTLKQAFLAYITRSAERARAHRLPSRSLGISTLLIGSGFGGLTIYSCVRAIMMAVKDANGFFAGGSHNEYMPITHIEIIELYLHKAVQAARIIGSLLDNSELFSGFAFRPGTIKRVSGSQNRIPDETQTDWWHRLKVYEPEGITKDNGRTRLIRFSSITDKARNEEELLTANMAIVDQLVRNAARYSANTPGLCEALYEMMIPEAFKGYGSDLRNIVFIVDKETAKYPWEMLRDAYSGTRDPLVTRSGFIRQLSTGDYRRHSELAKADSALVIGNPVLNGYYPDLPGAAAEAGKVAEVLQGNGFEVQPFINVLSTEAIISMYSKSYKIVHIAAHGVLRDKETGLTGVVAGERLILTPDDFRKMRYVPELIFVNCCSLGVIDKEDEERLQRKYEVAAGVGTQLIEMGARAVIVAGWEVDDAAARCFSETFYRFMLDGRPYGEAVRFARKITYDSFPAVNTWGAYQCYGDPFYTLRSSSGHGNIREERFFDLTEASNRLETFISKLESATSKNGEGQAKKWNRELEAIIKGIEANPEWQEEACLISLIAEAYQEMGETGKAVLWYEKLFPLEKALYSFRSVEQYGHIKVKHTVSELTEALQSGAGNPDVLLQDAEKVIDDVIHMLERLGAAPTSERLSMLGGAYKAKAQVDLLRQLQPGHAAGGLALANLAESARLYQKSYEQFRRHKGKIYYYPLCNWLQLASILNELLPAGEKKHYNKDGLLTVPADLNELLQATAADVLEMETQRPGFWNKTALGMQYLLLLVRSSNGQEVAQYSKSISAVYKATWRVEGSLKKIRSVTGYMEFLAQLFAYLDTPLALIKAEALAGIIADLRQLDPVS